MIFILLIVFVLAIFILGRALGFNLDYTRGSNLYKSSNENLEGDQFLDVSDHSYYDRYGKMK